MKTIRRTIMTLAALAGLAGCAKENADSPEKNPTSNTIVTLTANQENAETKAEISTTDSKVINWKKDDAITVIDGDGKNVEFTLTEGEGTRSGKFKGEVSKTADSYIALYPYQKDVTASEGALNGVVLKSEQTAVAGSFDPEAALMMAESEAGSLSFKNIVGFVKVTPTVSCARITLVSNNSESKLAGTADINMTDGKPTATVADGASSSVSIVGDIKAGSTYYIAIFPETLADGFRLVFTTSDGQDTYKSTTKQLEIKRNYVTNLGNVEGKADEYPYVTFTAASEQMFKISKTLTLECSVGGSAWQSVGADTEVEFGGLKGSLRLRGKNEKGTYYSTISFTDNDVLVRCKGDIRTLIDWEYYGKVDTKNACFSKLFYGCSVLTSAPALPATELADYCYKSMFNGCTSLKNAPDLPAKKVPREAYSYMFNGCTSLTTAPAELPATELAKYCYERMFCGCKVLENAPDLPAENVPLEAYSSMFSNCFALKKMPKISAKAVADYGMAGMFAMYPNLEKPGEHSNLSEVTDLYIETFTGKNNCASMFINCTSLTTAPKLPATKLTEYCYMAMFAGCENLSSAPALNATEVPYGCYQQMFMDCTSLKNGPALLATEVGAYCYQQMFCGCTGMESGPEILPAKKLSELCYQNMFRKCKSLTKAPKLMAEEMAKECCNYMFKECSKLDEVTLCVKDFDTSLSPFSDWLAETASNGTVHIRKGLDDATKAAIYLPNSNWTFVEDVTD